MGLKSGLIGLACLCLSAGIVQAAPAKPSANATVTTDLTGDRIDGVPVIGALDAASLPTGVHRFWFRVTDNGVGQGWYVPVIVVRGAVPGPRFLLVAGMHGDELNGIAVIHQTVGALDPTNLKGTLIALPGVNVPGMLNRARNLVTTDYAGDTANLNRVMPGDATSTLLAERYAGQLWSKLIVGNADFAIDLHTQSTGTIYPAYVFADTRNPVIKRMADILRPEMIKIDQGEKGVLETTLTAHGIPTVTFELGGPRVFDSAMVARGVRGVVNVMKDRGMVAGAPDLSGTPPFIGNDAVNVRADIGGFATILVALLADVKKDQTIATIADPFGRVIKTYTAPVSGRVSSIATDPLTETGGMLVRILTMNPDPACRAGC